MRTMTKKDLLVFAILTCFLGGLAVVMRPASEAIWQQQIQDGQAAFQAHQSREALRCYARAVQEAGRPGADVSWLPESLFCQAEASEQFHSTIIIHKIPVHQSASLLPNYPDLADSYARWTTPEPEVLYQRAYAEYTRVYLPNYPGVDVCRHRLADCYFRQEKYRQAESLFIAALVEYKHEYGPDSFETAHGLMDLASYYRRREQYARADALLTQIRRIHEAQFGRYDARMAPLLRQLATFYQQWGHTQIARRTLLLERQVQPARNPRV